VTTEPTTTNEPVIASCSVGPGHDGRAEVVAEIAYPNGGRSWLSIGEEALGRAVDAAGVRSLDDLVGRPWTVLLAGLDLAALTASGGTPPINVSPPATSANRGH